MAVCSLGNQHIRAFSGLRQTHRCCQPAGEEVRSSCAHVCTVKPGKFWAFSSGGRDAEFETELPISHPDAKRTLPEDEIGGKLSW